MRPCPICNQSERRDIFPGYDLGSVSLYECGACGFRFVDGEWMTAAAMDEYYRTAYRTDDLPFSAARLDALADYVAAAGGRSIQIGRVLDIGGTDGELVRRLLDRYIEAEAAGVGDNPGVKFVAVVLSHTLEHIYDLGAMFRRIRDHLRPGGLLVIEGPYHPETYFPPQDYDFHWQHVNKFRVGDLRKLADQHGLAFEVAQELPDYREYKVLRCVWRMPFWND
jgi:SAM-dependent methyltransferase